MFSPTNSYKHDYIPGFFTVPYNFKPNELRDYIKNNIDAYSYSNQKTLTHWSVIHKDSNRYTNNSVMLNECYTPKLEALKIPVEQTLKGYFNNKRYSNDYETN